MHLGLKQMTGSGVTWAQLQMWVQLITRLRHAANVL